MTSIHRDEFQQMKIHTLIIIYSGFSTEVTQFPYMSLTEFGDGCFCVIIVIH